MTIPTTPPEERPPTVLPDNGFALLGMDPDYFGSCPCFRLVLPEGTYEGHCWRVDSGHNGCGLHFEGDRALAEQMVELLTAMDWYGEWALIEGLRYPIPDPSQEVEGL